MCCVPECSTQNPKLHWGQKGEAFTLGIPQCVVSHRLMPSRRSAEVAFALSHFFYFAVVLCSLRLSPSGVAFFYSAFLAGAGRGQGGLFLFRQAPGATKLRTQTQSTSAEHKVSPMEESEAAQEIEALKEIWPELQDRPPVWNSPAIAVPVCPLGKLTFVELC